MDKPAFPVPMIIYPNGDSESVVDYGMTFREHAAITLRVPDSGDEQLDSMIRQANRRDAAVAAMQGILARADYVNTNDALALADALLAKLECES